MTVRANRRILLQRKELELNERLFFPPNMFEEQLKDNTDLPIEVTQTQFVGFLTWKKLDG